MIKYLIVIFFNFSLVLGEEINISKPTDLIGNEVKVVSSSNNINCSYTLNENYKVNSSCWEGSLDILFWEDSWVYWEGTLNDQYIFEGFIVEGDGIDFAYNLTGDCNDW